MENSSKNTPLYPSSKGFYPEKAVARIADGDGSPLSALVVLNILLGKNNPSNGDSLLGIKTLR